MSHNVLFSTARGNTIIGKALCLVASCYGARVQYPNGTVTINGIYNRLNPSILAEPSILMIKSYTSACYALLTNHDSSRLEVLLTTASRTTATKVFPKKETFNHTLICPWFAPSSFLCPFEGSNVQSECQSNTQLDILLLTSNLTMYFGNVLYTRRKASN